jgi:hypothetical protein
MTANPCTPERSTARGAAVARRRAAALACALLIPHGVASAAPVVQGFEDFPIGTAIDSQIAGLTVFAPAGHAVVVQATAPLKPSEPRGLISDEDDSSPLVITFESPVVSAGALIDFGNYFAGLRLTAFTGEAGTGDVVDTVTTQLEGFLSVSGTGIRSIVFEEGDLGTFSTFLIDDLTYEFVPEPTSSLLLGMGLALQAVARRRVQRQ